jgi:twitching motility protein PilT
MDLVEGAAGVEASTAELIAYGLKMKASDWHFVVGEPLSLRICGMISRCDARGGLEAITVLEEHIHQLLAEHTPPALRREFEVGVGEHLDTSASILGERFRLHFEHITSPSGRRQMSVVLRHIPSALPEMEDLGLPLGYQKLVQALPPHGLVLVTGASGSGKTTTLAASLNHINRHVRGKIYTLEAPVEFFHRSLRSLVVHRNVGLDVPTFQRGIEAAMRSDPDVILVGEMRDLDTITSALSAAETGHLVFASLHTNTAPGALSRILDAVPEGTRDQYRSMLASSLRAVLAQRLMPQIGGGRIAAFEFMVNTTAVASQIRENKLGQLRGTMKTGKDHHMVTLDQSLKRLVVEKKITRETALEHADNRAELEQELRLA